MAGSRSYRLNVAGAAILFRRLVRRGSVFCPVGEGGHDLAGEATDVLARAAEIDQHVFDRAFLQILDLAGDLIGAAEDSGLVADAARLALVLAGEAVALVAAGPARQIVDPYIALVAA